VVGFTVEKEYEREGRLRAGVLKAGVVQILLGQDEPQLIAAVKKHLRVLQAEQLVTDKPAYVMRAGDGTIVEVFEWRSADAINQAHTNPSVHALWAEFGAVCDYTPLTKLKESQEMFAEFDAVSL
jgi:hypothetical protein